MRKDDGIHFSAAGADKLAFYLSQTLKLYYRGGGTVGIEVADALARHRRAADGAAALSGAGADPAARSGRRGDLAHPHAAPRRRPGDRRQRLQAPPAAFDPTLLIEAPVGRVDAFGVGKLPEAEADVANAGGR